MQPKLPKIEELIERTDAVLKESPAYDAVPVSEKAVTLAMLYQAAALTRIADALETIVFQTFKSGIGA